MGNFNNTFGWGCCGPGGGPGGSFGHIPFCFCDPIPSPLTMTSADPTCNFRMFQGCTLVYQPTPPVFAPLTLGPNIFTNWPETFPDPLYGGATFSYYLFCNFNQFNLTRLYITSPFGSPFRDAVLFSWLVGGTGNTCVPFHLDNGTSFPGSDLSCNVFIDQ